MEPGTLWRGQVRESRTATRTDTDGHGRLERAEVRGQGKPEQPNSHLTQGARGTQKDRKRRGRCRCARWAHWFGGERNSLCAQRAQLQNSRSAAGRRRSREMAELFFGFYRLRIFCGVCVFCVEWFLNSSAAGHRRSTLKTGTAMNSLCARRAQLQFGGGRGEGRSVLPGWVILVCKLLDGLWVLGQFTI